MQTSEVAEHLDGELRIHCSTVLRGVHALVPSGPVPTAQTPDGVYPYESFVETAARPELRRFRVVTLENARVIAVICPDLGGKVLSLALKAAGDAGGSANVLADPGPIRPVRILPRGAFVGGGIEVSFPISHTPSLLERVCCSADVRAGRARVCVGERELRFGMHWTVEWSLGCGETFLTQRTRFLNPTPRAHRWMSWANAGVPSAPDSEFYFPSGPVLVHGDEMKEVADWGAPGAAQPRTQGDIARMTAFFWRAPSVTAFGVFTPSTGSGLFHSAERESVGGIKLWSDGVGEHERWVSQYMTHGAAQLLEVQAGPLPDQSVKDVLAPGEDRCHVEHWHPASAPLDIAALAASPETRAAAAALGSPSEVPLFSWARPETVAVWLGVEAAYAARDAGLLPPAPDQDSNAWAPSGMDSLGTALAWAASLEGRHRGRWAFLLGAWIAGRETSEDGAGAAAADSAVAGERLSIPLSGFDAAFAALAASDDGRAYALAARLHRRVRRDCAAAAACFRRITEEALALHPQICFERDLTLAGIGGAAALAERRAWLDRVGALQDEWLLERRAALLADEGRPLEARALLESREFQLVHQRYARTRLWHRILAECEGGTTAGPRGLGEDTLAKFGAYRDVEEDEAFE